VSPLLPKARLESLTDGIFEVAMTLLVLDLGPPEGSDLHELAGLPPAEAQAEWREARGRFAPFAAR